MVNGSSRKAWIAAGVLAVVALLAAILKAGLQGGPMWQISNALLETVVSLCVAGSAVCLAAGLGFLQQLLAGRARLRTYVVLLAIAVGLIFGEAALQLIWLQPQPQPLPPWLQFVSLALSAVTGLVYWFGLFVAALAAVALVAKVTGSKTPD